MEKTLWTPEEDEELLDALQKTEEPTFTERCKRLAEIGWHKRSNNSIETRARRLGYNKVIDFNSVSHSMTQVVDENRKMRDRIKELESFKFLVDEMAEKAVIKLKPFDITIPTVKPVSSANHAYWLALCDWQGGSFYTQGDLAGRGEFNSNILEDAVSSLENNFFKMYDYIHKAWVSNRIVVNILGDMIEGVNIYRTQRSHIDKQRVMDQAFFVARLLYQFLAKLAQAFPYVSANCVIGNHGRVSKDHHEMDNWDYLVYKLLQLMFTNSDNVSVNISLCHAMAYTIPDMPEQLHFISHGEEVRSAQYNVPYYNMDRYWGLYSAMVGRQINYFTVAHHHKFAESGKPGGQWLICPPLIGTTAFSTQHLGQANAGAQLLAVFHPKRKVFEMQLETTELTELSPDENGILTPYDNGKNFLDIPYGCDKMGNQNS